ncbi:MAG: CoA-binding protein, partial [Gammaproteobacteria bacterium]
MKKHYLHKVFEPQSVAIVGASERDDSVGAQVLRNIRQSGYKGDIYPVNPKYKKIQELRVYPSISAIDHPVDLVIIAIPAKAIPNVMRECGEHGVGSAVILSAGFAEVGKLGQSLQDEIIDIARTYAIPLIGPNCLGVIRPRAGLNATFARSSV